MTEEKKNVIKTHYDELAEELSILYQSLCGNGFTNEQAIDILLSIVSDSSCRDRVRTDRNNVVNNIIKHYKKENNNAET